MPRPMVPKLFRNPQALSSALAALETLQPGALGFLNSLVTLVLASNYYLAQSCKKMAFHTATFFLITHS